MSDVKTPEPTAAFPTDLLIFEAVRKDDEEEELVWVVARSAEEAAHVAKVERGWELEFEEATRQRASTFSNLGGKPGHSVFDSFWESSTPRVLGISGTKPDRAK